jgi:hypothetical protein
VGCYSATVVTAAPVVSGQAEATVEAAQRYSATEAPAVLAAPG